MDQAIHKLRSTIVYSLNHDLLETAEFTSERLIAIDPNNLDSIFLYGLVLYKSQRYNAAYNIVSKYSFHHVGCSYIYAKCALKLDLSMMGVSALQKTYPIWSHEDYDSQLQQQQNQQQQHLNQEHLHHQQQQQQQQHHHNPVSTPLICQYTPDTIACYMLLAKLYAIVGDSKRSAINYVQVLKLNPYIFQAFEELCRLGIKVRVNSIYKVNSLDEFSNRLFNTNNSNNSNNQKTNKIDKSKDLEIFDDNSYNINKFSKKNSTSYNDRDTIYTKSPDSHFKSNNSGGDHSFESLTDNQNQELHNTNVNSAYPVTPRIKQIKVPDAPVRRSTRSSTFEGFKQPILPSLSMNTGSSGQMSSSLLAPNPSSVDTLPRKSARNSSSITSRLLNYPLNTLTSSTSKTNNSSAAGAASGATGGNFSAPSSSSSSSYAVASSDIKLKPELSKTSGIKRVIGATFGISDPSNSGSSIKRSSLGDHQNNLFINSSSIRRNSIIDDHTGGNGMSSADQILAPLYLKLAKGYKSMSSFDCFKAIRIFDSLPENEKNTPWVLGKLGRLHFEIVNYEEAENYFVKLRKLDRTRIKDMEYYSTLLWHLHKETELSFLSHELHEINKNSAESWVAIGNLFSLKREADEAIKCFQKAGISNPNFAYAFTLQGHEYLSNDAFENALECFRHALLLDRRHYNAFYGIGMVYLKLGDFRKAEFHFRKAVEINPVNVILICCVGMVLEKLGKKELALRQYMFASKLQPLSMLALFKKAQAYFSLQDYESALKDFEKLEVLAPDEASVHYLLGKLYRFKGRKNDAIKQFTIALNLDPKGSHLIREALESLDDDDEDEEFIGNENI
ncbi:unnamed protein product [[Candida] boidinii]|nr:unnamed protein product [[Candida] boidinii]